MKRTRLLAVILLLSLVIPLAALAAGGEIILLKDGGKANLLANKLYLLGEKNVWREAPFGEYLAQDGRTFIVRKDGTFVYTPETDKGKPR